ncbi:MAG: IS66 family insertion sequence element accessory protein TnpB [Oligoflexales bacterium]
MKSADHFPEIFLFRPLVDMRKQVSGLASIVEQEMLLSPSSDALFVFTNKTRKIMKALYWDKTGFALWTKHLEKDRYYWPRVGSTVVSLSARHFSWLLDGIDLSRIKIHKPLSPTLFS